MPDPPDPPILNGTRLAARGVSTQILAGFDPYCSSSKQEEKDICAVLHLNQAWTGQKATDCYARWRL